LYLKNVNLYNFLGSIACVLFDSTGEHLLTTGDRQIRVFHNVVGARIKLNALKTNLKTGNLSSAMKERVQQQINQAEKFLVTFDG